MTDDVRRWAALIAELARMPDVVARMTAEHVADEHGRCRACTVGGLGVPGERWPCALAALALDATIAARRAG